MDSITDNTNKNENQIKESDIAIDVKYLEDIYSNNKYNNIFIMKSIPQLNNLKELKDLLKKYDTEISMYGTIFSLIYRNPNIYSYVESDINIYGNIINYSNILFNSNRFLLDCCNLQCSFHQSDDNKYILHNDTDISFIDATIIADEIIKKNDNIQLCSSLEFYFRLLNELMIFMYAYNKLLDSNHVKKYNFRFKKNINFPDVVYKLKTESLGNKIVKLGEKKDKAKKVKTDSTKSTKNIKKPNNIIMSDKISFDDIYDNNIQNEDYTILENKVTNKNNSKKIASDSSNSENDTDGYNENILKKSKKSKKLILDESDSSTSSHKRTDSNIKKNKSKKIISDESSDDSD
jgi:hypothetical protein